MGQEAETEPEGVERPTTTADVGISTRRQILAGVFGHMVEWFDWAVYTYMAIFFADQFFPDNTGNDLLPLIGTFGVFAIGFVGRPFGGMLLGAYGDRHGRRAALTLSISMMGLGSLAIAVMPTYDQIGLLAPIGLTLARIFQGISTGGEFGAASAFISESSPDDRRGLYSSLLYVGSNLGKIALTLTGSILTIALSASAMGSYGWRVMFLAGAVLALVGWYIRRNSVETAKVVLTASERRTRPGMFDFFKEHPAAAAKIFGLTIGPSVIIYILTAYLPVLAVTRGGLAEAHALQASTVSLIVYTIAQPLSGALSDRVGRRILIVISSAIFVVASPFLLHAVNGSFVNLVLLQTAGLVTISLFTAGQGAMMAEQFPPRLRVSGIAFPFALSISIFGGTAPLLATALQRSGHLTLLGGYISLAALITLVTAMTLKEYAGKPLPT